MGWALVFILIIIFYIGRKKYTKILYKNPVISAVSINIITLIVLIYSVNEEKSFISSLLPLIGILNRRIIDKGVNLNKKKKAIMITSFLIMLGIFIVYATWIYKLRKIQILSGISI